MNLLNLQQQAAQYLSRDEYDQAIDLYEQCLEIDATNLNYYWYLGLAHLLKENEVEAQAVWLSAIAQAEEEHTDASILSLVETLESEAAQRSASGREDQAWIIYQQVLVQDSMSLEAHKGLGIISARQNKFDEAILYLKKAQNDRFNSRPNQFNRLEVARYGLMLYNIYDKYIGRSLELYGEFSEGEPELFKQFLRTGQTVLDIGANIGTHTLFFAKAVGQEGVVHAFEPQRIVFQTLCGNLALNSITNVYTHNVALGAEIGEIRVPALDYASENNFGGIELEDGLDGEAVEMQTVDSLHLPQCHFIKIDVEGMELQVLKGAVNTLAKFQPILYVENDRSEKSTTLIRHLHTFQYRVYWHKPPIYNPNNFFNNPENIFPGIVSFNVFCIHQSSSLNTQGFTEIVIDNERT